MSEGVDVGGREGSKIQNSNSQNSVKSVKCFKILKILNILKQNKNLPSCRFLDSFKISRFQDFRRTLDNIACIKYAGSGWEWGWGVGGWPLWPAE